MILFLFFWLVLFVNNGAQASNIPTTESGIPKVIHYVWLGSKELPENAKKAVATWQKYQPDFQLKLWNEEDCNINANTYARTSYQLGRYQFAGDYCKAKALLEGGIYFDTDMLLKAPIEPLLDEPLVLTLQSKNDISASFMAVVPNHPFVKAIVQSYEEDEYRFNVTGPFVWLKHFRETFHLKNIEIGQVKGKYHIYNPNILMYDFGGGECVAEHLFGNGSKDVSMSDYYWIYRNTYLQQFAFSIPAIRKYFIKKNEKDGYFFDFRTGKASDTVKYRQIYNLLKLEDDRQRNWFFCFSQVCYKLF